MFQEKENALHAQLQFADFRQAMAFMLEVAFVAEAQNHHPEWSNVYNRVQIRLTTHDAGNTITEKDRLLAQSIAEIYTRYAG